jgi:2'-deoxynucleoside 5'-phosphate N-hydrolase
MKKVYFACSIRGGRADADYYAELVVTIKKYADVLTEIFADKKLTAEGMSSPTGDIWSNDLRWIGQADAVIAEVTNPSLGVGYEIAAAEKMGKPVLCLYRPSEGKKLSAMISGSPGATIVEYTDVLAVEHAIATFMSNVRVHQTVV